MVDRGHPRYSFSSLPIGAKLVTGGRTLTETDLSLFCMLTGDWHGIHADSTVAASTTFGRRIFQGTFGIALAQAMAASALQFEEPVIAALGFREWSFRAPMFIGDTVHAEVEIADKRLTRDCRGIIARRIRLLRHDGDVLQEGLSDLMVDASQTQSEPRLGDRSCGPIASVVSQPTE